MGKRNQKKQRAAKIAADDAKLLNYFDSFSSAEITPPKLVDLDEDQKGISNLPEEILLKILHYTAFNKNLKEIYQSSDFFKNLIDGSTNLKNKLILNIHSNPAWKAEYLCEITKANVASHRQFKIGKLVVGSNLPTLSFQDVNTVMAKQTELSEFTINIKMMRDAKSLRTILFGLKNSNTLKRLSVRVKSSKKNINCNFSDISQFPGLEELSLQGSHNPTYSLFNTCKNLRVLELDGLFRTEDFSRSIVLINNLKKSLKSLNFVDVVFEEDTFVKLQSLGLQLNSIKFYGVDISACNVGEFSQFILSQKELKTLNFHGIGITTEILNDLGKSLLSTELRTLKIEMIKYTVLENVASLDGNNWRLDNLTSFMLSGACVIKTNLIKNIFCHRNDNLKVLKINAYVDLKNDLLCKIVTNYTNLTELSLGPNCHFQNADIRFILKYLKELKHLELSLSKLNGVPTGAFVCDGMNNTILPELTSITIGMCDYVTNTELEALALCIPKVNTFKFLNTWKKFDDQTFYTLVKSLPFLWKLEMPDMWVLNKYLSTKAVDLVEGHKNGTKLHLHTESGKIYDMKTLRETLQDERMDDI